EMIKRRVTKRHFHKYINPQRVVEAEAIAVHGITNEFLQDKPLFADIVDEFIEFIKGAELVIHNAPFDVGFINHEFNLLNRNLGTVTDYSTVFDTLAFARKKHAGQRNTLDALCKRYGIDNSHRNLHGALLDSEILADVFLAMTGGQSSLLEENNTETQQNNHQQIARPTLTDRPALKVIVCNETEQQEHEQRLAAIDKASGGQCVWNKT
ncbi:partial DNA polymerase III subunit epsilon, partial [Candidatus Brocadiaceae bacterium]